MRYQMDDIQRFVKRFYGNAGTLVTPFAYPVSFAFEANNLSPAERQTANVNIQANGDFLLIGLAYRIVVDGETVLTKSATDIQVSFRESGSKSPFTDAPVSLENYASNGVNGRSLDYPRFLAGGSNIEIEVRNASISETYATPLEILLDGMMIRVFN